MVYYPLLTGPLHFIGRDFDHHDQMCARLGSGAHFGAGARDRICAGRAMGTLRLIAALAHGTLVAGQFGGGGDPCGSCMEACAGDMACEGGCTDADGTSCTESTDPGAGRHRTPFPRRPRLTFRVSPSPRLLVRGRRELYRWRGQLLLVLPRIRLR